MLNQAARYGTLEIVTLIIVIIILLCID